MNKLTLGLWELIVGQVWWVRTLIGAVLGGLLFGGVPALLSSKQSSETPVGTPTINTTGNITNNSGIVTQGQKGDNVIRSK
jgi:hypothetical protein